VSAPDLTALADPTRWVEPRDGFLPPRYLVLPAAVGEAPPAIPLTDLAGETPDDQATLGLAWSPEGLELTVRLHQPPGVVRGTAAPEGADFWTQDHVELRWLRPGGQVTQFMFAPGGRWWDSLGLWQRPDALPGAWWQDAQGWGGRVRLPWALLGQPAPAPGTVWRGLLAQVRWAGEAPRLVASTAAELGFSQWERLGEWRFVTAPPVRLRAWHADRVELVHDGATPRHGRLVCWRDDASGAVLPHLTLPVVLPPGGQALPLVLPLTWPGFTRWHLRWQDEEGEYDLGAVTRRGTPPPLRFAAPVPRPGLLASAATLAAGRANLALPCARALVAAAQPAPRDLDGSDLPAPDAPDELRLRPADGNWFRVARETMLRDGAGGRHPAAARLWALQPPAAQEAWRGIVASVTPTAEQVATVLNALNSLLVRRDWYDATAFARVRLPAEGRALLARGLPALSELELQRFNRMLLAGAIECLHTCRMDLASRPGELWQQWLLTGDPRLIATATATVRAALRLTLLGPDLHLHEGMAASGLALAYDSFHPHLDDDARAAWRALLHRFLALYLDSARRHAWTVTTIANANPVGNAGAGLAALALRDTDPELAAEVLGHVRRYVRHWLDYCHGPDGGNTEGAQYWQYGLDHFLRLATAWERHGAPDDGWLRHPAVTHALAMVRVGLSNDGAMSGVNDTIPMPIGGGLAWWLAGRTGDPLALWFGDHAARWLAARRAAGQPAPYLAGVAELLCYRPPLPEATAAPPLPTVVALASTAVGLLRSAPRWDCRYVAGLTGARPPFTHHQQTDAGSCWLDAAGERLLLDPGYYQPEATDHCLPLLGGVGPARSPGWTANLFAAREQGPLRVLAVDATLAHAGRAARVRRWLVMAGEAGVVLLDDLVTAAAVTLQYQCGGPTEQRGDSLLIHGRKVSLQLDWAGPERVLALAPERSLHTTHWGYHFADCRWFPATVTYAADVARPMLTICRLAAATLPPPVVRWSPAAVTVQWPGAPGIAFHLGPDGWAPADDPS
jgi:hypothetical protein